MEVVSGLAERGLTFRQHGRQIYLDVAYSPCDSHAIATWNASSLRRPRVQIYQESTPRSAPESLSGFPEGGCRESVSCHEHDKVFVFRLIVMTRERSSVQALSDNAFGGVHVRIGSDPWTRSCSNRDIERARRFSEWHDQPLELEWNDVSYH